MTEIDEEFNRCKRLQRQANRFLKGGCLSAFLETQKLIERKVKDIFNHSVLKYSSVKPVKDMSFVEFLDEFPKNFEI